jgi:hypothetical protein
VDDDRDWGWLERRGTTIAAPAPVDAVVWRVTKPDGRWAEARLRTMAHARELRFIIGGPDREPELMWSVVPRDNDELTAGVTGVRQDFLRLGWQMEAEPPTA